MDLKEEKIREDEDFGEYLRRERILRNISLEEISNVTKIKIHLLQALEESRFDKLPPQIYVRGFLRAYSRYVGLDENDVLLRYESSLQKEKTPISIPAKRGMFIKGKLSLWIAIVLIIITSFFFLFLLSHKDLKKSKTELPGKPNLSNEKKKEINQKVFDPSSSEILGIKDEKPQDNKTILLEARTIMTTWIRYTIDKNPPAEVLLRPGESFRWEAKERLKLVVGNAGGVRFILNKRPMDVIGKVGEVVTLEFPRVGP